MDGTKKLNLSEKVENSPKATYKALDEKAIDGETVAPVREVDGADEKMLPNSESLNFNVDQDTVKIPLNEKQNGDAKLDIGETKNLFGGMDKEELMKYINDPFWVRLRWFLFVVFWLLWAAMLIGAIMIIYAAPKCDPPPPKTWWEEGPLTEIEPDTKPEDIQLLDKNIKGFIVSWPDDAYVDFNDSSNVIKLITQAKKLDIKVIVDLDPATSNVWFNRSEDKNSALSDYYIWRTPKTNENGDFIEPNNWVNVSNQPSWQFSGTRQEFYYSPLGKPHLNFRNENVTNAFSDVIKKFINHGASGIRVRNAPLLLVDPNFRDETTQTNNLSSDHKQYSFYVHTKTENSPDLGALLKLWKTVVRNETGNGPFIAKGEISDPAAYKVNNSLVVDLPLIARVFTKTNISVKEIANNLNNTLIINNIKWPLWKVNSTVLPKDALDMVIYLLPGVPLVNSSDTINVHLLKIRQSPSVMSGICSIHSIHNNTVFSFIRVTSGNPGLLVALNPLDEKVIVNFPQEIPALNALTEVTVQLYSSNFNETDFKTLNAKKDATAVPISPRSVIVLSYVPHKEK